MATMSHLIKQNTLYLPILETVAETLYYSTGLPILIFDSNHKILSRKHTSSYFDTYFEDTFTYFPTFIQNLIAMHKTGCYTYSTPHDFSYLVGLILIDEHYYGALLLGPYFPKEMGEHDLNQIMAHHHVPISSRSGLRQVYATIPVLTTMRHHYLQQLILSLLIDSTYANLSPIAYNMLPYKKDKSISFENLPHNYALEIQFLSQVASGNIKEVVRLYEHYICPYYFNTSLALPFRTIKNNILQLVALLSRTVITKHITSDQALSLNTYYVEKIEETVSTKKLRPLTLKLITHFTNIALETPHIAHTNVIKKASDYIHQHFSEPIRLEDVAKHVNLSTNYFSSLFKQEMHMAFAGYLNQVRIKESQYLLGTTIYSIQDIAFSVGFNNQNYFTTIFKKISGITPKQYRMHYTQ